MDYGETEVVRKKGNIRLLKTGCRHGKEAFCVVGDGDTYFFDDYEDALEEFNLRWMRAQYGD